MIHLSSETADLLKAAGKGNWVSPREDKIIAKGKGELQTYWLTISSSSQEWGGRSQHSTSNPSETSADETELGDPASPGYGFLDRRTERLVKWHVELLSKYLRKIAAQGPCENDPPLASASLNYDEGPVSVALDEVKEIVSVPVFAEKANEKSDARIVELDSEAEMQLTNYVSTVASM